MKIIKRNIWGYALLLSIFLEVLLTVVIPETKGFFFSVLETKNAALLTFALGCYFLNYVLINAQQVIKPYLQTRYSLNLRETNQQFVCEKYHLAIPIENPEQRIQEDIKLTITNFIKVWSEYLISGLIVVILIGQNHHNPLLVGTAVLYSVISVLIAYIFQPKMIIVEKIVQKQEAQFRKDITILNYLLFPEVIKANIASAAIRLKYGLFANLQNAIMVIAPFFVLTPMYFQGTISLGDMMLIATTFDLLVLNMSILINLFPTLTQANASFERVKELFDKF